MHHFLKLILTLTSAISINSLKLQQFINVQEDSVTVSGLSSGAAMTIQLHIAFSSLFKGAGIIAGPPYNCANGLLTTALTLCMADNVLFTSINIESLHNKVRAQEIYDLVDSTVNLSNDRVYIFAGTLDTTVKDTVTKTNSLFYHKYLPKENIKEVFNLPATHAMITDNYGRACNIAGTPFIVNCNYNLAHDMLSFIYNKTFEKPSKNHQQSGDLIEFDQTEFFPLGSTYNILMGDTGYVYVPKGCQILSTKCKLHVALHGCKQQKELIGNIYAKNAGYNHVADLNNMIILYPQAKSNLILNPNGCWDWWGYTDINYTNKLSKQMRAIRNMVDRILSNK